MEFSKLIAHVRLQHVHMQFVASIELWLKYPKTSILRGQ